MDLAIYWIDQLTKGELVVKVLALNDVSSRLIEADSLSLEDICGADNLNPADYKSMDGSRDACYYHLSTLGQFTVAKLYDFNGVCTTYVAAS
jgi:hypothetical protein